jgi:hypothetical protein
MGMLVLVGTRNVEGLDTGESGGPACHVLGARYVRVVAMISGG